MSVFIDPGDAGNPFYTPFTGRTSSALVYLNFLTPQQGYQNRLPQDYIDDPTTFTTDLYMFVVDDNRLPRSATTVEKHLQNVHMHGSSDSTWPSGFLTAQKRLYNRTCDATQTEHSS